MRLLFAALIVSCIASAAHAQQFPNRPIRMVVGFSAGGGPDITARLVAPKLAAILGQQVVIDNRPGAGGSIAEDIVAKAAPDGYTVLACSNSLSISPFLYEKLPYDPVRDLAPIHMLAISAQVLVVQPVFAAKSVSELIALAKSNPAKFTFASSGNGAGSHLAGELFKLLTATELVHVPYKGGGQGVTAVIAGETHMMFAPIAAAIPHVRGGRLRALAVTTSQRTAAARDIPTMQEAGVPRYEAFPWYALLVPARTPKPIRDALEKATKEVIAQQDTRERMLSLGLDASDIGSVEFSRFLKVEMNRWQEVVRKAALRPS